MASSEQKTGMENGEGSNFTFLQRDEPLFFQLGSTAERLFPFDPNASLLKLRQLGEAMAQSIAARVGIPFDERTTQSDLLYAIARRAGFDSVSATLRPGDSASDNGEAIGAGHRMCGFFGFRMGGRQGESPAVESSGLETGLEQRPI